MSDLITLADIHALNDDVIVPRALLQHCLGVIEDMAHIAPLGSVCGLERRSDFAKAQLRCALAALAAKADATT